jgi:hypothetical protein
MFIRSYINTNNKSGKPYNYFAIVENERVGSTTTQKTVLKLGSDFDLPKEKWPMLIKKIEKYIKEEPTLFETSFNDDYDILAKNLASKIVAKRLHKREYNNQLKDDDIIKVRKSQVDCEDYRSVGAEHVALNGVERLGLSGVFESLNIGDDKVKTSIAAVVARMIHPASERETFRWLNEDSSLSELLGVDFNSDNCLHRTIDFFMSIKT